MKKYTSVKITNLSWVCSIFVVLIHATTYAFNLPRSTTESIYGKNISTFVQMFFAEGLCRVAVPFFFIFSRFLFFQNFELTKACIANKFKRRIFSLLIPYLFWSGGTFLFFYIAQSIPATAVYFSSRSVVGIGPKETLHYILIDSLNSPLWYLRNLIILTMFTPLIYVLLKYVWYLAVPAACLCGLFGIGILSVRGSAICAFTIGSFFAIQRKMLSGIVEACEHTRKQLTVAISGIWLLLLIGKACYLCTLPVSVLLTGRYTTTLHVLNDVSILIGIPVMWLLYDAVALRWNLGKTRLGKYGMMLFVMHHPIISIVKKVLIRLLGCSMCTSLICYFASAIITIAVVLMASHILRKYAKGLYRMISGGR